MLWICSAQLINLDGHYLFSPFKSLEIFSCIEQLFIYHLYSSIESFWQHFVH